MGNLHYRLIFWPRQIRATKGNYRKEPFKNSKIPAASKDDHHVHLHTRLSVVFATRAP